MKIVAKCSALVSLSNPVHVKVCNPIPFITKTSPCNEHPLTSYFHIVKLGFTGVYNFSYFCSKTLIVGTR